MRLSEERIAVLARNTCDRLLDEELIDLEIDEERFFFLVEQLMLQDLRMEDQIDEEAASWLQKHRPYLQDGTPDWEIALEKVKEDIAISKGYVIH
jgi:hypothetical protein